MAVTLIEKTEKKKEGKDKPLNAHTFRILDPQLLKKQASAEEEEDDDEEEDGGPGSQDGAEQLTLRERIASHWLITKPRNWLFNRLLALSYYGIAPLNDLFLRLRPRPAANRPLRVLRMTTMISQGGVAKVALQTLLRIPPAQAQTSLLVFGGKQPVPPSLKAREDIPYIKYKLQIFPGSYNFKMFKQILKLARIMIKTRADLVHVHEPQFAPAVRIAAALAGGRRLVLHLHNDYNVRHARENPLHRALKQHALRRMRLIACSQTIFDAGVEYLGQTRWPLTLIEDGADDRPDCPPDERLASDLARAANGRIILAKMAHLMPHKRIEDFLMACRILLDEGYPVFALLMCYGKDRMEEKMRETFNHYFAPEEGEFLFRVHAPQHILNQVGIGITTSALEGLGLNVLEYQVEGVPVVASDLKPHREMITPGEDGLVFPVGDVPALLRELKRLLGDEALRQRLGEAGRQRARRRTWDGTARNMVEFYRSVVRD